MALTTDWDSGGPTVPTPWYLQGEPPGPDDDADDPDEH
jgi:hypothetical protein